MKVLCKILGLGERYPASDGSVIPRSVMEEYLNSETYQKSIEEKTMISSLTHRCRNLAAIYPDKPALQKTIGKNDALLMVDNTGNAPTPTHVVTKLFIRDDDWLWGVLEFFDEDLFDDSMAQNIKRIKGLLKSGLKVHTSAVIIGFWSGQKNGVDLLKKCVSFSGVDCTFSSSWKDSHIERILDDDEDIEELARKSFSDVENLVDYEGQEGQIKAKCFSNLGELGVTAPKTSKIDNQFTVLKAKSFSSINPITVDNEITVEEPVTEQKEFSQTHVIERVRLSKMSPRMKFRRLILDYRQALKSQGGIEKIDENSLKVMKSLFTTDLLNIMQEITPMILAGKNINALLGSSSLGVQVRKSTQALQVPYRLALMESKRQGFVSKQRYQKIQDAYQEFTKAILDYVFNTPTGQKLAEEEEVEDGKN